MAGGEYYVDELSAERLRRCYEIAPPRVRRYFDAEIGHVLGRIRRTDVVLDLGCGYGRVMDRLAVAGRLVVGADTSGASLQLARRQLRDVANCRLVQANAVSLGLGDGVFDVVVCIQNGISAFGEDQGELVGESIRVTRRGGRVLFSTYSAEFWDARLDWFRRQSEQGLIGEIDEAATGDGVIVCKDGFRATTLSREGFARLTSGREVETTLTEVDGSSLFCEIIVR